jgi:hypothetical protein
VQCSLPVNAIDSPINTRKKNTAVDSKEVGADRAKYTLLYRYQNAGQNHDVKIGNRSLEIVLQFKYL